MLNATKGMEESDGSIDSNYISNNIIELNKKKVVFCAF
ncbi:hypothetical protein NARC_30211 [Candidatus Nitrosocosmicus arcticus]|uniref:Uncharacterized protein n=1 Tax=Candidatus Nitrosocosmicus arcticus TaxID=2035267 RepID=A0A557SY11_9ARCH|nr:hypothetical protein NARC_30211 [Candidatus Nitrosocosmicus arcticus]